VTGPPAQVPGIECQALGAGRQASGSRQRRRDCRCRVASSQAPSTAR